MFASATFGVRFAVGKLSVVFLHPENWFWMFTYEGPTATRRWAIGTPCFDIVCKK
jgi:hypothetical protein